MTFTVSIGPGAASDLADARNWYEAQQDNLGAGFLDAIQTTLDRITEGPLRFPIAVGDARRALVPRFPYSIYFRIRGTQIRILAVIHQHRDPGVSKQRLR